MANELNINKCAVLRCTHSPIPIQYAYTLMGHTLEIKKLYTYLGVGIDNTTYIMVIAYTNDK